MAAKEEEFAGAEVEVAAILCGLKKTLRAREQRWRRRMQRLVEPPEIPSWGRRRPRSIPEEKPAPAPASGHAAASPNTPLAYPESGGDDAPVEEAGDEKTTAHEQEQHGVVASLSQENAHLLKQIEEYRARLQSSRSTNESLKQLHKGESRAVFPGLTDAGDATCRFSQVEREHEQERARKRSRVEAQAPGAADPRAAAAAAQGQGLDLNEPARAAPEEEQQARARQAQAIAAAAEWYRQTQLRAAMQKAAVTAGARRRRLEILRAKVSCPLVSSRPRAGSATTARRH
ncbi:hypothetical protein BAE44_0023750 [Dichanthelium oligosanthes]|uniref:Uncharacterized protein n=1 Tax=Dichanthelium oligosanthes TaxID=888268 RepID=A0A1E5UQT0_9POAL|nr:hypothetical protein BAE44_0023750 [Dichanthelium oligosanthes]